VFEELAFASLYEPEPKRGLARKATARAHRWGVSDFELSSPQDGIAERFAHRLITGGLLPEEELNDARILAEVGAFEIPLLVTSDNHLLDIDEDKLLLLFTEAERTPARPVHPRRLLRALR
jgi:hypothetical protein